MINKLKKLVDKSNNIVFFGGAGVSTESNIPDFRSSSGLYSHSPEYLLSHTFFINNPKGFYKFYKEQMIYLDAKPNSAHYALAELEKKGKLKAVITQNIDGLHQKSGSKNVLELHGSIYRNKCMNCMKDFDINYIVNSPDIVPVCDECKGIVKPEVTLYEEGLNMDILSKSIDYIRTADLLIVGGTSLVVYPAANLITYFRGRNLVLINKGDTNYDSKADLVINDSIGKVLKVVVGIE